MRDSQPNRLSILLLSYYSGDRIPVVYNKLKKLFEAENIPFEMVVMDDGSKDNSFEIAQKLEAENSNVKAYQLSRNFTSHYSVFAALSKCTGDYAIPIPDDEQMPYGYLVDMYRVAVGGEKVIIPFRENREDKFIFKMWSSSFYKLMNSFSEVNFPKGGADSFMIEREVIDIINNKISHINTSSITEVLRLGFSPYYFPYQRPVGLNENKSRWSFRKKMKLATDLFFSSSNFPIRLITFMGMFFSGLSFIATLFFIYTKVFGNKDFWGDYITGWTSLIVAITFFSGMILFSIGILSAYIWRIYEEVKGRPAFIIKK